MTVVSNSGPLINLAKVGQFALLNKTFRRLLIPPGVFDEVVVRGAGQPGSLETQTARWIMRRTLKRPDVANILRAELDQGEAEAIALALQEKADWLLIDERKGRRFAQQVGLQVKGTLGILVEGVRRGRIAGMQPILDEMRAKGTWISPTDYRQVIELAHHLRQS